jgi:cobalt-zinc-cadmium efflux system membrane fusion protein
MTMATTLTIPTGEKQSSLRRRRSLFWKLTAAATLVLGVGGAFYFKDASKAGLKDALKYLQGAEEPRPDPKPAQPRASETWDGLVEVDQDEQKAIGFTFAPAKEQTEPIVLELTGRTAYDDDTITRVRPRFDTRVEDVFAKIGQKVKKGDPLVLLYSTDLAQAKTDFQTKYVQWQHDLNLYNLRQKLVETGAISQQLWVDTQNDEQKSRLDYYIARDKLLVFYEVPKSEIDPLLEGIGSKANNPRAFGEVTDKAKMTLRSKAEGIVIWRDVVPGNYYESTDKLMEIAPLDHLWVWVNVFELDQSKISRGQTMVIQFPFMPQRIHGSVDFVDTEVSKETRAVRVRATIPNRDASLKSNMLVKAMLEVPPVPGQTVIPRLAMVSISGDEYVFVRRPRPTPSGSDRSKGVDKFERRKIDVAQENSDHVVVRSGLKAGEEVVANGSLILSQLYEDKRITVAGLPAQ